MKTIYGSKKRATREMAGSTHTLPILFEYAWSMARVWLEAACKQARRSLEYGWSMLMTTFLRPFSSKRAELERRLAANEITSRPSRDYVSSLTRLRLVMSMLLMLTLGSSSVWGATINFNQPDGYYYLGNDAGDNGVPAYDGSNFEANFYMCPAYSATVNEQNYLGSDDEKPLITTFKSFFDADKNQDKTYSWAVWYIEAATGDNAGYFYIKHRDSGKYLVANDNSSPAATRRRVNLGPTAKPDGNDGLFYIQSDNDGTTYYIYPKEKKSGNNKYLTPSNGNKDDLSATNANDWTGGIIGFYTAKVKNSAWHFVLVPTEKPTITYDNTTNEITMVSATTGATIYYTTDGSEPDKDHVGGSNPTKQYDPDSKPIISTPTTIKAIAVADNYDVSEVRSLSIQKVETPIKSISATGMIELSSATPSAVIYYTIGDTEPEDPTVSSNLYTGPLDNVIGKYIKAIGVKEGWINSDILSTGQIQLQCATPVITRVGMTFTISCVMPADAAIYYSTNGGSETLYSGPVAFTNDQLPITVTAVAKHSGYTDSEEASITLQNGSGTPEDPYLISGDSDFSTFITDVNNGTAADKCFKLISDISASGVAEITTNFTGSFDGGGYTISGLRHALFNSVNGGVVKNVILDDVSISDGTNTGAIANKVTGTSAKIGSIYNCGVLSGSVSGSGYVGSIVGQLGDSNNDNCYARVINCFSYATVSGGSEVGGIVGYNSFASTAADIRTMVMNCMFYGDITGGSSVSPVYGGEIIDNLNGGLNNFNYYAYSQLTTATINKYNCALAVEEKYLTRFEFYRLLLNSNKKLAAFYATGSHDNADQKMLKWVLESADRTIDNPKPYPVLKAQGYYPSIINPDFENAPDSASVGRNHGGKLGKTLSVTIGGVGSNAPDGARITNGSLTLKRTDKDEDRFNFNYDKVQLPYYNDVGEGNYTGNRVVTGWKIIAISSVANDPYTSANYDYSKTYASNPSYFDYPNYNFADRKSSNKDLYSVSGRVFSQGAYFDVPYGVTSITIEPYWGKAYYIADPNYDVVYYTQDKEEYKGKQDVTQTGTQVSLNETKFNGQPVETSITRSLDYIANNLGGLGPTVYDNALVLVGNLHLNTVPLNGVTPFTMMSVDADNDHEPDYSLIYHHKDRSNITPIRFDFLNIPGTAQAQKPNGASLICNFTIFRTRGWFEVTNTAFMYSSQIEYENGAFDKNNTITKIDAPLILLGGIFDQFVSTQSSTVNGHTIYIHVGSNVWINSFGLGTHSDGKQSTPHVPVSVTGGDFEEFYLTGTYNADSYIKDDNAECYISGGRFGEVAGASLEQIGKDNKTDNGNVRWQIYDADIKSFFGGGINDAKPVQGNITTEIFNSHVNLFCGGPKFGNMTKKNDSDPGKTVTTTAFGCTFGKYFGAGYGGNSISKKKYYDKDGNPNWSTLEGYYTTDKGKYFDGATTGSSQISGKDYGKKGLGVATDFDYEYFVWSSGTTGVRLFVEFATFSTAQCNDVSSTLKKCTVETNFYGGGNLGKVAGTATSELEDCTVIGSVYGAGYSASLPTVEVRDAGFTTNPNYNSQSGMFEPGVFSGTTTFTWQNAQVAGVTLTNGESGSNLTNHILYTNTVLTGLGEVAKTNLTIKGTTTVGESVYGGGEESGVNGDTEVNVTRGTIGTQGQGGVEYGNVYGGGKGKIGDKVAGYIKGNTTVNISQASAEAPTTIYHNVYGGGAYGSVGDFTYDKTTGMPTACAENTGSCTVNIKSGTFGWNGKENGMVFGSSRGDVAALGTDGVDPNDRMAWVYSTRVTIGDTSAETSPTIKGSVYGSGENGHTFQNTIVDIKKGIIGITTGEPVTDNNGTPNDTSDDTTYSGAQYPFRGNVYGGGCGTDKYDSNGDGIKDKYNPLAGIVQGTATVNITGGHVVHNVYGAGAMGSVGGGAEANSGKTTINVTGGRIGYDGDGNGHVFGAARGEYGVSTAASGLANVRETVVNINYATTPAADNEDKNVQLIAGSVFGGGEAGTVKESVAVNMTGGLILKDVYGGGALADTQTSNWDATLNENAGGWAAGKTSASATTTVRLTGGRIGEEVFGGGLGEAGKPAYVWGDVLLDLNGTTSSGETGTPIANVSRGCVVHEVFGCNNVNGTPKGDVMVHVYATQNAMATQIANTPAVEASGDNPAVAAVTNAKVKGRYDVTAVYGGGNQAAYNPVTPNTSEYNTSPNGSRTQVIIEGCSLTSINTVYGGGNAAAVPETDVVIKSAYEIGYLFGGGNGKDDIAPGVPNPGADVGTPDHGTSTYGTGNANTLMEGGLIHEAYGGSNTKGIIKGSINQITDPKDPSVDPGCCELVVEKIVGAGKYADVDGDVNMTLSCQPEREVSLLFAGADEANVNGNITLNITNGHFGKVFGGNNLGGVVKGKITVNVEETGCQPIKIDDLYLGGNEAAYSVFGYYESEDIHPVTGKKILKPRTSADDSHTPVENPATDGTHTFPYAHPVLNIISCTYIGNVFGGGFGKGAIMYANPKVNVNMVKGLYGDTAVPDMMTELHLDVTKTAPNPDNLGIIRNVFGGGDAATIAGDTYVNIATEEGKSAYIIGSVFGGGNAADVLGNTNVTMSGGYVFNGIFGGGYAGSVGTFTRSTAAADVNIYGHTTHEGCIGKPVSCAANTGKCTILVNGGQIGPISVATEGMPVPQGWVWGGGQGLIEDPEKHPDTHFSSYVGSTDVTIAGTALIMESIIGGGEFGRVFGNTLIKVEGGQIGVGANQTETVDGVLKPKRYTDDQFVNPLTTTITNANALAECSHYPYGSNIGTTESPNWVYLPYDPYYEEYPTYVAAHPELGPASTSNPSDGKTWIGCVFGGGSGYMPYKMEDGSGYEWVRSAGWVEGNSEVRISGGHILTNVYGANEVTDVKGKSIVKMSGGTVGVPRTSEQIQANPLNGNLFGAGKGDPRSYFNKFTNVGSTEVEITGGIIYGNVYGGGEDGHVFGNAVTTIKKETGDGKVAPVIGCVSTSDSNGNVFGGGQGASTALTAGVVGGNITLNVLDGSINGSVYGGGEMASVGTDFDVESENYGKMQDGTNYGCIAVNLTGGTIKQNVYGGCMGTTENDDLGVSKNVLVELNKDVDDAAKGCVVLGSIFGCNNVNSSPEGSSTVHIYKTQRKDASRITNTAEVTNAKVQGTKDDKGEYVLNTFDVQAVYGGGNLAAYTPKDANGCTNVIIDGCSRTSIGQVYGGGNAASTPATSVTVNGTFEIGELFGGGNGKDKLPSGADNPGANVGYKDYHQVEDQFPTKEERVNGDDFADYRYGTGLANVTVKGGTIHRVFGGSNTKGNVRKTALTMLEEVEDGGTPVCDFHVDEAYGGGKSAQMDAEAKLLMACIPGLEEVYGGAEAADIHDNVTLTITNGTFNRVFGGNNISGTISGNITVNIEEVGCRPIIIGELYGGGNLAAYSIYGYDEDGKPKTSGSNPSKDPEVNVHSFTSIGSIFGGGFGEGALMVASPTVNINEVADPNSEAQTKSYTEDATTKYYSDYAGETKTIAGHSVILPSHEKGKMGAINTVFGGGNAAEVQGNTTVNIGTAVGDDIYMAVPVAAGTDLTDGGYYTRTGTGEKHDPYVYTSASGNAAEDVTYYKEYTVLGVDIRDNIYGGGNNAKVTGNTEVNIGKKAE